MASKIYNATWIEETLERLAENIAHNRAPGEEKAIVGLRTRGAILADRLCRIIGERHGMRMPIGYLDVTMYRDDLHRGAGLKPVLPSELAFNINDKTVILVDDVISTGRSVRAAMGALFDYGRPASVRLCVMLDRGGRELPVGPDFVGAKIEVAKGGFVRLKLKEADEQGDSVYVVGPGEPEP